MKKILLISAFAAIFHTAALASPNPKAAETSVVVCGNARFTVLTDRLVRMEWSEDGKFEDRATLGIVNRNLPRPEFNATKNGEGVTIRTNKLILRYNGGRFDAGSLSVSFTMKGKKIVWHPGDKATANLKGTARTLDRIKGLKSKTEMLHLNRTTNEFEPVELEDGIISRDGWAIVDESRRHIMIKDGSDWGEWVAERPAGDRQDLYIFAYGHDYKAALSDFSRIAGRIPMPPKYCFGYWWSRYWIYTDEEILAIASEMRERKIPMDVMIVDMDWHETWKPLSKRLGTDEFDQRIGWTGYTWNSDLFPDPKGFLSDLHKMGYRTALNLHPASGIQPYEEQYEAFVKDYLSRTEEYDGPKNYVYGPEPYVFKGNTKSYAKEGHSAPVPFRLDQQAWADAYFSTVIRPMENMGVDFWWLDWQQFKKSKYVKDLSNTFWCNWAFFNDKLRKGVHLGKKADRPFTYHRWGGIGSHRYPLGFSGDIYDEWSALQMLPYFTATASNVGYGYWGHDIGGHMQLKGHFTDPQMYTRWLQYGVFTPIFKTHSGQSKFLERKIWAYPSYYKYMKEAIELRYALSPYIYTASRTAYDTGICICRPLYYEYPEEGRAYEYGEEFFFGNDILATVLCAPADSVSGKTERKMWFPSGCDWYDMASGTTHRAGSEKTLYYSIDQNPWFVRSGAVIPLAGEGLRNLQDKSDALRLLVVPGKSSFETRLYEDDGESQSYDTEYAFTRIRKYWKGSVLNLVVEPREGSFDGASTSRKISVVLEGQKELPRKVRLNSENVSDISLDGRRVLINLPSTPADQQVRLSIEY